jgi:hypothetical protein
MITPPRVYESGKGEPFISIVCCMHGNETLGEEVVEQLHATDFGIRIRWVVANVQARKLMQRYIESDLNRSFPGNPNGTYEEQLAVQIANTIEGTQCVLDLHTTTANTAPFVIMTKPSENNRRIAAAVPIKKLVHIPKDLSKGKALIDIFPGAAIECSERTPVSDLLSWVKSFIENWKSKSIEAQEEYEGTGLLQGDTILENFSYIPAGITIGTTIVEAGFYPVLSGEVAYKGISCIMCKKM